jgi:hypothetical protein
MDYLPNSYEKYGCVMKFLPAVHWYSPDLMSSGESTWLPASYDMNIKDGKVALFSIRPSPSAYSHLLAKR